MKRVIACFTVIALLVCLCSCGGKNQFGTQEEMLNRLEGMYLVDDADQNHYFIFQDGDLFETTDEAFVSAVNGYVASKIKKEGIPSAQNVDFKTFSGDIATVQRLCSLCNINADPGKGIVSFSYSQIIVEEDSVTYKNHYGDKYGFEMKKISNKADFTGTHFAELFENTVQNYAVPLSTMFSAEEYLKYLKIMTPSMNDWILVDDGENSKLYTSDGKTENSPGAYVLTDDSLRYLENRGLDGNMSFYIEYDTGSDSLGHKIFLYDHNGKSLYGLLGVVSIVLENIPGSLTKSEIEALYEKNYTVSDGARVFHTVKNDIEYNITKTTDGKSTVISITLPKEFKLSSLPMDETATKPSTTPTTTPTTAPSTTPTNAPTTKPTTNVAPGEDPCAMGHTYENGFCVYCLTWDPFYEG